MKRHIFFIGTLCNGGAERVVSILASQMARQGITVEILTYYDREISYEIDSQVIISAVETKSGKKGKLSNLLWLRKYFRENAKIIISFLAPFNMMAIAANFGNSVPIIVADRNDPTRIPANKLMRKLRDILYGFATAVVVQTKQNQAYFSKIVQKKSHVIYNPIDLKGNEGSALHTQKEKKIVTAGRLMPQKNQKMLIQVFCNVLKRYPDYELYIYGEGPSREELEQFIEKLGIRNHVFLPGNVKDIHDRIKDAEIFVLSSDYEGMPNALIEAMCLGLPVISTKVSGATDLIINDKNGILVEVNSLEQLQAAMLELIENKQKRSNIAKEAVRLAHRLDATLIMEQWIKVIEKYSI